MSSVGRLGRVKPRRGRPATAARAAPGEERAGEQVRLLRYEGCAAGAAVELYVVAGGGHTWSGATDVARLGATTHEISATDLIWKFFAARRLP